MTRPPPLARRLGLGDAVFIGLGSMIGAGVFSAFAPAAAAAGTGLLVGLAIAGFVAYCNAAASAQLAAVHPTSGGTYAYARAEIGPWSGFIAGWAFVIGKLASCAAMALTFAAYAAPAGWERPVAVAAVAALAGVNLLGITRTAQLTRILVTIVLLALAVVVAAGWSQARAVDFLPGLDVWGGGYGILQSAGLLFFAFAGYARIATMGEEVRQPARTIPRAIMIALALALVVYAIVALTVLSALGPDGTASSTAPLADTVAAAGWTWAEPIVRVGAAAASLGALLALIAGIGRTTLAMAREADLPPFLAAVHPWSRVPARAEIAIAIIVIAVVAAVDLRGAIGFSSFGVLLYYLIANAAAFRQRGAARRYARALQLAGGVGCAVLAFSLPPATWIGGLVVVGLGLGGRAIALQRRRRRSI